MSLFCLYHHLSLKYGFVDVVPGLADIIQHNFAGDDDNDKLILDEDEVYAWKELRLHPLLIKSICRLRFKEPTPIQKACIPVAAHQGKVGSFGLTSMIISQLQLLQSISFMC